MKQEASPSSNSGTLADPRISASSVRLESCLLLASFNENNGRIPIGFPKPWINTKV